MSMYILSEVSLLSYCLGLLKNSYFYLFLRLKVQLLPTVPEATGLFEYATAIPCVLDTVPISVLLFLTILDHAVLRIYCFMSPRGRCVTGLVPRAAASGSGVRSLCRRWPKGIQLALQSPRGRTLVSHVRQKKKKNSVLGGGGWERPRYLRGHPLQLNNWHQNR